MDIKNRIDAQKIVKWRRHFHMYPELSFKEFETAKYIVAELSKYPEIEILRPAKNSVVAVLKGKKPGKTIGLRADIDALPITEEADVEFKSKNPGVMHACGHDFHAAMLLGAVDVLYQLKDEISGCVKFIFQHAEELVPGGAVDIVASGVLDDVEMFYGSHVFPSAPVGMVRAAIGPIYANADTFYITIKGKGAHGARPEASVDSLLVGLEVAQSLNYIVSRNVAAKERAVVTVGAFNAGSAPNIIPDSAQIMGTTRSYSQQTRDLLEERVKALTKNICAAYGAECIIDFKRGYSAVVNDEKCYFLFKDVLAQTLPEVSFEEMVPIMGGEDFSAYGAIAPSIFVSVGAGPKTGAYYENHNPRLVLDEDALFIGTALYAAFAVKAALL